MPNTAQNVTPEQINQALFQADPMHTGCQENDCFDEYQRIANAVAAYMSEDSLTIEQALYAALSDSFVRIGLSRGISMR